MVEIRAYMDAFIRAMQEAFGAELIYVGLQGSYLRGEATEHSDIDAMVVLEHLTPAAMDRYRGVIARLGDSARSCGFLCGRQDLACWNPLEILHLVYATQDLYGRLADLVPTYTERDARSYVKLSIGNLYHELCHRYVHSGRERSIQRLPGACKAVFFILQDLHFLQSGAFSATKDELLSALNGEDREILALTLQLSRQPQDYDFDEAFARILAWCQSALVRTGRD